LYPEGRKIIINKHMNYKGQFPNYEFSETQRLNPCWSSLVCFHEVIKNRKTLHPRLIRRWFYKLVGKDDYAIEDKCEVLRYALKLARGEA
jgi:hypothetical protein